MQLKVRLDRLLLGVGALVLLVGALLAWQALRPDPEQAELDRGLEQLRAKPGARTYDRPRFIRQRGNFSGASERSDAREGWAESQTPQAGDPGDLDAVEAIDTFQAVIDELEAAVARL